MFQKRPGLFTNVTKERQFDQAGKLILSAELDPDQKKIISNLLLKFKFKFHYKIKF